MSHPRVVVPGVVEVVSVGDGRGVVDLGPLCDVAPAEPAHESPGTTTVIPVEDGGPAVGFDLGEFPHVAARIARARWVMGEPSGAQTPFLRLTTGRFDGRFRDVSGKERWFQADQPALWRLAFGEEPPPDDHVPALHDRCIRALSAGAVSLRDVELARWIAGLAEDLLPVEEQILAEIAERAEPQMDAARSLVAAIGELDGDGGPVPVYGTVERVRCPAFQLRPGPGVEVEGPDLSVPEASGWLVDGVEDWEPGAALLRREASFSKWQSEVRDARDHGKRKERRLWILIVAVLLAGIAVLVGGQLALMWLAPGPDEAMDTAEDVVLPSP